MAKNIQTNLQKAIDKFQKKNYYSDRSYETGNRTIIEW
jgi:hypothetical protein